MRLMKSFFASLVAIVAVAFAAAPSFAQQSDRVQVDIDRGHLNPMPIAVIDFLGDNAAAQQVGRDIAGVIRADLDRSGLFRPIGPDAFIERIEAMNITPRFADWKIIDAQALGVGEVQPQPDGRMRVVFRLWDVFGERQLTSFNIPDRTPDGWRRIAHHIADEIYEQLTGERGYFDTQILFVSESGDALQDLGVEVDRLPVTPERLLEKIMAAEQAREISA
jgi:TolB protein